MNLRLKKALRFAEEEKEARLLGKEPPPRTPTGVLGGPPPSLDGESVGTATSDEEGVVVGKAGAGASGGGGGGSGLGARIVVG